MSTGAHKVARGVGSTVKWTIRLGLLFIVVVTIAVILSVGNAANKSEKNSQQVTPQNYTQVHNGMTRSQVEALLGSPESSDTQSIAGLGNLSCIYYGILAQSGTYQFCFSNGALDYKAKF